MKHKSFQMLLVLMSVFFFAATIFMIPKIAEGKQSKVINKHDKDGDGKLSKDEFQGSDNVFDNLDKNQDGYIDIDEAYKAREERSKKNKKGKSGKLSKDEDDDDKDDKDK